MGPQGHTRPGQRRRHVALQKCALNLKQDQLGFRNSLTISSVDLSKNQPDKTMIDFLTQLTSELSPNVLKKLISKFLIQKLSLPNEYT